MYEIEIFFHDGTSEKHTAEKLWNIHELTDQKKEIMGFSASLSDNRIFKHKNSYDNLINKLQ